MKYRVLEVLFGLVFLVGLYLFAHDTVADQLAWSIRMLYEHPALCTEMGAAGAARGKEFSTAHYYEEFVRIVRDVTENGGAQ